MMKKNYNHPQKLIFVTCMPMSEPRSASMYYMKILLDRHASIFTWFSLRKTRKSFNEWEIPYCSTSPINFPKSNSNLRRFVNLYPWAFARALKAIWFGWNNNVQIVFSDLAFEAVIVGRLVAKILNVPLISMIHDDPINRIEKKDYPKWILSIYKTSFKKALKSSTSVSVISDYMGEFYQSKYDIKPTTLFPGIPDDKLMPLKKISTNRNTFIIGMVGSINCMKNWLLLIEVCEQINRLKGKDKIKIIHVGKKPRLAPARKLVEYCGHLEDKKLDSKLSRFNVGLLTWEFRKKASVTVETSLPLKIISYIKAGIPMFAFGPERSSIVRFVHDNKCGTACTKRNNKLLFNKLTELIENDNMKKKIFLGLSDLRKKYSREKFHSRFLEIIRT